MVRSEVYGMKFCARVVSMVALVGLPVLLAGCGGSGVYDGGDGDLVEIGLTMVLRVQDADGNAIGDARVYVDGDRDDLYTDSEYWTLDEAFPAAWQDFEANWFSDRWALYGDAAAPRGGRIELVVRKLGWTDGLTIAVIPDSPDEHFWVRDTITLYPSGSGDAEPTPQYAEVLAAPPMETASTSETKRHILLPGQ